VAKVLQLINDGTISGRIAKDVFEETFHSGRDPEAIVKERGLVQISDTDELSRLVAEVVAANPNVVEDYRNGKDKALGYLVGQVMKATRGKANPQDGKQAAARKAVTRLAHSSPPVGENLRPEEIFYDARESGTAGGTKRWATVAPSSKYLMILSTS